MKKKIILGLSSVLLLSGCGGSGTGDSKITLTVWEDVNNHEMLQTVAENFIANYKTRYPSAPDIAISFVEETEGAATDDLSRDGPAGNGPDVFAFVHDTLSSAVNNDLIAPVSDPDYLLNHHSAQAVRAFTYEDIVYGYPITSESLVLMYDSSKLTASDVASYENIKASGEKIVQDVANSSSCAYYTFNFLNDVNLFGANGVDKSQLNLATTQAVNNLTTLTKEYQNVIVNGTPDEALTIISVGDASGVISSPYLWSTFKDRIGASAKMAVVPSINGVTARPFSGYKGYGVSRYSKHPELAQMLAKYLVGDLAQEIRFVQKGLIPTLVDNSSLNSRVSASGEATTFIDSLNNSLTMPNIVAMGSYWADMQDAITEIWNLGTSATDSAVAEILSTTTSSIKNKIA